MFSLKLKADGVETARPFSFGQVLLIAFFGGTLPVICGGFAAVLIGVGTPLF